MLHRLYLIAGFIFLGLIFQPASAASIVGSKHDLSTSGYFCGAGGRCYGGGEDEICVHCHTPHGANTDLDKDATADGNNGAPLWNRQITDTGTYAVYTSSTMNATCGAIPSPLSLACLSCHDGAAGNKVGAVNSTDTHNLINTSLGSDPNCGACHAVGEKPRLDWQIGSDLSDDHPVSFAYADAQATDGALNVPTDAQTGWADIKLFNGRIECPSCHNAHDPANVPFLRQTMDGSALCLTCHIK